MKIIIYFLLVISSFAQDSTNIASFKLSKIKTIQQVEHKSENEIKPLMNIPINRNWARGEIQINKNYKSLTILRTKKVATGFIDSDLFLISVGSAIIFGTTAAYLKLEADKNYNKYLSTTNIKYLDKTNRLDLYSGISLGIMEINFGYLIYKFLTD